MPNAIYMHTFLPEAGQTESVISCWRRRAVNGSRIGDSRVLAERSMR
jgi:hypothetical protein